MPYWTLTFMIICLQGSSAGVILPECMGPIKAIEIMRDGMTQAVTCQNLNQQQNVAWLLIRPTGSLEICTCNSTQCSSPSGLFKCSGNSSMSYVELKYPSETLAFDTLSLGCKGMPPSSAEDEANCGLDAVYVGMQSSCKTYFNTDDWTVIGECTVSNASSFRQRYSCLWTERSTNIQENIPEDQTFLNITPLSGNTKFVNFTCGFKKPIPIRIGSLDYSLITYPGGVKRQVTFQGNNAIDPPSQAPVLSGYEKDKIVYAGDILNITCIIPGGHPVVTSTFLKCLDKNKSTDGQISNLSFRLVSTNISSIECICTGTWGFLTSLYTLNSTVQLNVFYPPSPVVIFRNSSNIFPYLEGDTVDLVCDVESSPGNPVAELSWSGYRLGQVASRSIPTTLQLTLQREDNNRNITCKAKNTYTESKGIDVMTYTTLKVYYRPEIFLKSGNDNSCEEASNPWLCSVTEGQQVDVECTADSNPPPANMSWRLANKDGPPVGSGSRLIVRSANFTADSGVYICSVTTEKMNATDIRLPLTSERQFTIIVTHQENHQGGVLSTGASVGVTIAVFSLTVAVTGIVLFVWARRQGWILPCADVKMSRTSHQEVTVQLTPSEEQNRRIYENEFSTEDNQVKCRNDYAILKVEEIGLTPTYSDLKHYEDISGKSVRT